MHCVREERDQACTFHIRLDRGAGDYEYEPAETQRLIINIVLYTCDIAHLILIHHLHSYFHDPAQTKFTRPSLSKIVLGTLDRKSCSSHRPADLAALPTPLCQLCVTGARAQLPLQQHPGLRSVGTRFANAAGVPLHIAVWSLSSCSRGPACQVLVYSGAVGGWNGLEGCPIASERQP